jgi:hypothetical protein
MQPVDLATDPQVLAVTTESTQLEARAAKFVIKSIQQYADAGEELKSIKAAQKRVEDLRTTITKPMNAALKAVNDFFRVPTDRLATAELSLKRAMGVYADEQHRQARAEQAAADERARKERERIEAQAAKAEAAGRTEKAEELQMRAATTVAPIIQREPPKVTGISTRDVWKFEITDPDVVPREYLLVDEVKIRKVVGALKGETKIAGVRVYTERQIAAGAA